MRKNAVRHNKSQNGNGAYNGAYGTKYAGHYKFIEPHGLSSGFVNESSKNGALRLFGVQI